MTISWREVTGLHNEVVAKTWVHYLYVDKKMSLREIEVELGKHKVTHRTIARMLVAEGVKMRPKGGANYVKDITIPKKDYLNMTYAELQEKYNVSVGTVRRAVKHYDPKPRLGRQPMTYGDEPNEELRGPRSR